SSDWRGRRSADNDGHGRIVVGRSGRAIPDGIGRIETYSQRNNAGKIDRCGERRESAAGRSARGRTVGRGGGVIRECIGAVEILVRRVLEAAVGVERQRAMRRPNEERGR